MDSITEQIMKLPAGRALDAHIAERLFGEAVTQDWPCGYLEDSQLTAASDSPSPYEHYDELHPVTGAPEDPTPVPFYSTDISDAKRIQEHLFSQGWDFHIQHNRYGLQGFPAFTVRAINGTTVAELTSNTEALALCYVAILIHQLS